MSDNPAEVSSCEVVTGTRLGSSTDSASELPGQKGLEEGKSQPDWLSTLQVLQPAALVLLFVLGLVHWAWFLNFGHIPWNLIDWPKERAYCDLLQEAFHQGKLPLHISWPYHGTDRFLGNPEINLSPQILLLAFVDPGDYMMWNILLLYSAGFVGCLLIRRHYHLGLVSFATLWLLFNFNGHITAHIAASHPMWAGYFLLPFFLLWLLQWSEEGPRPATAGKLALVIVAILLQGSFHLAMWCWIFVGLFVLFNLRWWKDGLIVIGLSGGLMACRIIPGVVAFWGVPGHPVLPGYRDLWEVGEALAILRDGKEPTKLIPAGAIFWWEFDLYIGLIGLALVLCFGIASRWLAGNPDEQMSAQSPPRTVFSRWDGPILVLAFLSLNPYWSVIAALPLPLISSERVPSRFLLLPVLMLIVIAVIRLNDWLQRTPRTGFLTALVVCGLAELTRGLLDHSLAWHMSGYSQTIKDIVFQQPRAVQIVQRPDPVYVGSIFAGLTISGITALVWWWFQGGPMEADEEPEAA